MAAINLTDLAQPRPAHLPALPEFGAGDTVRVQARVVEGDRERLQPFEGVVIRVRNGPAGNFTVRRIASGVGVERTFPFNSPRLETVAVTRKGRVRRSRLYFLRGRTGRAARVKEARRG
jgi:large subunit ribosomal protein L19